MIAIHHRVGSFSERWIKYCDASGIAYKLVNAYDPDIVKQLVEVDAFLWHFSQNQHADMLFAKSLLKSLNEIGLPTFPDYNDCWHFDDKVAQKYLFEAHGINAAIALVFYQKADVYKAVNSLRFPTVFKLSTGAGSQHVNLLRSETELKKAVRKAFGRGYSTYNSWANFAERWRKWRVGLVSIKEPIKGLIRMVQAPEYGKLLPYEKGYVYLQEFIPNNDSDFRVIVIDKKAFAIKRMVRKGDFRASGSGVILYNKALFDDKLIATAFEISNKLKSSCMAYDFVYNQNNEPLLIEMSYGFAIAGYDDCEGYWDENLNWHEGKFNPYAWMVDDLINKNNG